MAAVPHFAPRQRARFDALKRQMFAEMGCAVARFRLAWVIPFNVMVIGVLALRGMSHARLAIEVLALFGSAVMFKLRLRAMQRSERDASAASHLFVSSLFYFLGFANTGGIASPLLVSCVPMLMSAALHPIDAAHAGCLLLVLLRRRRRPRPRGAHDARASSRRRSPARRAIRERRST